MRFQFFNRISLKKIMSRSFQVLLILFVVFFFSLNGLAPLVSAGENANPCNPCSKKNPCNPCSRTPIRDTHVTDYNQLVAKGKDLWNNDALGESGFACMTCHADYEKLNLEKHKGVWPHNVPGMTDDIFTLDQMVNFCLINPIQGKPFDPTSVEMTAMVAYYNEYIKAFNPCVHKPSANPCNPCGKKENPCNPCTKKNPCNPCGK